MWGGVNCDGDLEEIALAIVPHSGRGLASVLTQRKKGRLNWERIDGIVRAGIEV